MTKFIWKTMEMIVAHNKTAKWLTSLKSELHLICAEIFSFLSTGTKPIPIKQTTWQNLCIVYILNANLFIIVFLSLGRAHVVDINKILACVCFSIWSVKFAHVTVRCPDFILKLNWKLAVEFEILYKTTIHKTATKVEILQCYEIRNKKPAYCFVYFQVVVHTYLTWNWTTRNDSKFKNWTLAFTHILHFFDGRNGRKRYIFQRRK